MSTAAPFIIIFVILGGIVAWGAMTEWTFSGNLPRKGAKCTPDEDEKDENATKYVYDEDKECTILKACKKNWEPDTSSTFCEYSNVDTKCTKPKKTITNANTYKFDIKGSCSLAKSCKTGWKPSTDAKTCVSDTGKTCSPAESDIDDAKKYKFDSTGKCTLVKECDEGFRVSEDSKSCVDEWTLPTKLKKYQALGFPLKKSGDKKEPKFTDSKKTTIEDCRADAKSNDAQMFGLRAIGNSKAKSCWYYNNAPIETVPDGENISKVVKFPTPPQGKYWVECVDTKKSAKDFCTK